MRTVTTITGKFRGNFEYIVDDPTGFQNATNRGFHLLGNDEVEYVTMTMSFNVN
jgi:hypothetical protein